MQASFLLFLLLSSLCFVSPSLLAAKRSTPVQTMSIEAMEKKLIELINNERIAHELAPLKEWKVLNLCARNHSQNMADLITPFGHDGFHERGKEVRKQGRWIHFAENVAYSFNVSDPLKTAVRGWMKSPGHRKNILGDFAETGIGIAFSSDGKFFVTQLFATRLKAANVVVHSSRSFASSPNTAFS